MVTGRRRGLVILNAGFGNRVIFGPVMEALQTAERSLELHVAGTDLREQDWFRGALPGVCERGPAPPLLWRRFSPGDWDDIFAFLQEHGIDLVINFRKESRSLDGNYFRFRDEGVGRGWEFWDLHELSELQTEGPIGEQMCSVLRRHGIDLPPLRTDWLRAHRRARTRDVIGLFVGASRGVKRWPARRWLALIDRLAPDTDSTFDVASGPAEGERMIALSVVEGGASRERLQDTAFTSLQALVDWLGGLRAVVSCDTLALHLATAMGTPAVGVYVATDSRIWRPVTGTPFVAVQSGIALRCRAMKPDGTCTRLYRGCPAPCRAGVTIDDVADAVALVS